MHSLTRNFDDNDYVDKRGTKEVERFDLDFFDDVVKTFSLKTPFCGFASMFFDTQIMYGPLKKLGKYGGPRKK